MKTSKFFSLFVTAFLALSVSSCNVIGGILKTGIGVGIFIAVTVVIFTVVLVMRTAKESD